MTTKEKDLFAQFIHAVNIVKQFDKFVKGMNVANSTVANPYLQYDPQNLNFDSNTNGEDLQDGELEYEEPHSSVDDYIRYPAGTKFRFLRPRKLTRKRLNKKIAEQKKWYDIALNSNQHNNT
jgi:hypothetical protein